MRYRGKLLLPLPLLSVVLIDFEVLKREQRHHLDQVPQRIPATAQYRLEEIINGLRSEGL